MLELPVWVVPKIILLFLRALQAIKGIVMLIGRFHGLVPLLDIKSIETGVR